MLWFTGTAWPCATLTACPKVCFDKFGLLGGWVPVIESFQSLAFAVGQDEDSLALMRCANFTRAEYSPRRFVTNAFQFADDPSESQRDVSFDVLKEADSGSHSSNSICDPWPEMSGVVFSKSFSGCGEWLAGITSREDVHAVTKL